MTESALPLPHEKRKSKTYLSEMSLPRHQNLTRRHMWGENAQSVGQHTVLAKGILPDDQIERNEMGGVYGTYGEGRGVYWVWWRNLRERDHLEDPGVDGRIIFKMDLQEVGCEGMDWIELAQDRDRGQALVNVVMNLRVP